MRVNPTVPSSIHALQREYETIANNLANVNSIGFKRTVNDFSKKLSGMQSGNERELSGELRSKTMIDYSQGDYIETGRKLDVAICGAGFFVLETTQGARYTRNGNFNISKNGQLVNSSGNLISGVGGPVTIPPGVSVDQINISNDGNVKAGDVIVGKIKVVDFPENYSKLNPSGDGNFMVGENVYPETIQQPLMKQGYREGSNVNMTEELVALLTVTRMYEANMKILTKSGEDNKQILSVAMG